MPCGAGELEIELMILSIAQPWSNSRTDPSGSFNHVMTVLTRRRAARLSARL
jgi:hypothetical protein